MPTPAKRVDLDPAAPLKTKALEAFCLAMLKPDTTEAEAYMLAHPAARKWSVKSVGVNACKTAALPQVAARIKWLREMRRAGC